MRNILEYCFRLIQMLSSKIVSTHKSRTLLYIVITQTHRPSSHVEIKYLF